MSHIKGTEGLTIQEINRELSHGGKFVVYQFTISILIMTFKQPSGIHFVKSGESGMGNRILYTAISMLFGWWGIPWGPIYTIQTIYINLTGGKDVNNEVLQSLQQETAPVQAKAS